MSAGPARGEPREGTGGCWERAAWARCWGGGERRCGAVPCGAVRCGAGDIESGAAGRVGHAGSRSRRRLLGAVARGGHRRARSRPRPQRWQRRPLRPAGRCGAVSGRAARGCSPPCRLALAGTAASSGAAAPAPGGK